MSSHTPRPNGRPVVLRGEHRVTVTKEERHQAVLARHLSTDGRPRQMAVELGFCRIAKGKYRGSRAIEVRIDAERVGELTARMSERYAPLVEAILAAGGRPVCEAVVAGGGRGAQVELRLPAPEALPTSPPPPPQGPPAAWMAPPPVGPNGRSLPTAPTTTTPMAHPTGEGPGATRGSAGGPQVTRGAGLPPQGKVGAAARRIEGAATASSYRGPAGDRPDRLPAQRSNRKRKAVLWGVGVFLGLGFLGSLGDDEPAPLAAQPAAVSSVTATTSAQPTSTTTSATTTTRVPTSTGNAGVGAGAGAGADVPERQRITTRRAPTTTVPTTTAPTRTREQPASVYYKNCAAVRAAGAAPIRRGAPGYASHLDRDGDGVGCE